MRNSLTIEKLADGRFKVTQEGGFDGPKHVSAEELLKMFEGLCGGSVEVKKKPQSLNPQHQHDHTHHHHH